VSINEPCPFLTARGPEGAIEYCASLERTRSASTSSAGKVLTAGSAVAVSVVGGILYAGPSTGSTVGRSDGMAGYSSGLNSLERVV